MKYIKKFSTEDRYNNYVNNTDIFYTPNVSLNVDKPNLQKFNVKDERIVIKFNVKNTSNSIKLFNDNYFSKIEIDGVEQVNISSTYTFNTIGKHTVKYTLTDPTKINNSAFSGCSDIISVNIPDNITKLGYEIFKDCYNLENVNIFANIKSISMSMFQNCLNLTNINIPNSVTNIDHGAFQGCSSLISITIPDNVIKIDSAAFDGCSSLTNINIPNSVKNIGYDAFNDCISLPITNNIIYVDNWLLNVVDKNRSTYNIKNDTKFMCDHAFSDCRGLTSITIPNSITYISDNAFDHCDSLTDVIIPNSVTGIGDGAFMDCTSLTSITIPNSVTSIGTNAFYYSGLTSIIIPDSVTNIGYDVFDSCEDLTDVYISKNLTTIESSTFSNCTKLKYIYIPDNITTISYEAFENCSNLTSIIIGKNVTVIWWDAFKNCPNLSSIISNAITAPTFKKLGNSGNIFNNIKAGGILYVPDNSTGYDTWINNDNLGNYNWVKQESINGHHYVEIAGVKWAMMNIGANDITDGGLYFQWGDTEGYTAEQAINREKYFYPGDYKYYDNNITKYNSIDNKTTLDLSDDAATAAWGNSWRIPTSNEVRSLWDAIDRTINVVWTNNYLGSGTAGLICTDKTNSGKILFLPAAGYCGYGSFYHNNEYGQYWYNLLSSHSEDSTYSYSFTIYDSNLSDEYEQERYYGFTIRAVVNE